MKSVFIWCFVQLFGEEAEGEDSGSGDCDGDCVVEWWGCATLAQSGCVMVGGKAKIIQSGYHAGIFSMVFFTLCIHEFDVIEGIV